MENRFHNPYRHWVRGLVAEVMILGLYLVALGLVAAALSWVR